jgi:hypothetical protein
LPRRLTQKARRGRKRRSRKKKLKVASGEGENEKVLRKKEVWQRGKLGEMGESMAAWDGAKE